MLDRDDCSTALPKDPIVKTQVQRLDEDTYRVAWDESFTAAPVTVRAAPHADVPDDAQVVASGVYQSAEVTVCANTPRWYFRLDAEDGCSLTVGERALPLEGGVNFRDLGGYSGAGGRRIRWGKLFRSGTLARLTASDRKIVSALGISTVCDYRHPNELVRENAELPNSPNVTVIGIPPGIGNWRMLHELFARTSDPADTVQAMHQLMVYLARDAGDHYQHLFDSLLADNSGAFLMNCSGGKERSGIGAALTLAALGVPRETILYDYMLSSKYLSIETEVPHALEKYEVDLPYEQARALIRPLLEARPSYLEAAFDALEEDYGSVKACLHRKYGIDDAARERLCELYLA